MDKSLWEKYVKWEHWNMEVRKRMPDICNILHSIHKEVSWVLLKKKTRYWCLSVPTSYRIHLLQSIIPSYPAKCCTSAVLVFDEWYSWITLYPMIVLYISQHRSGRLGVIWKRLIQGDAVKGRCIWYEVNDLKYCNTCPHPNITIKI